MINWGKVPLASVLPFIFDSFDGGTGASITLTGLAVGDILVYKGTSMTQRSSTAGFVLIDTDGIDIDTTTGIHGFSIDTGDNTDAGFFVAGSFYTVVVASVTIDAQTVNFVAGTFWLGPTLTVAGVDEVDVTHWIGTACAAPTVAGVPEVDLTHVAGATTNVAALATNVDAILTDTADMQPKLGTPAGASISADILVLDNFVDGLETTIGAAGAGLTAVPWNAAWDAEVQSEVEDGLVAHRLDELLNADSDIDGVTPPTVGSVFHELMSKTAGSFTFDQTTDSNEAIRDKETDIETDTAEIGAAGAGLSNINLPNQTMDITGNITGNLSGSVGSVTGAVGSVTGAVGSVTAGVTVATGGIVALSFAAGAIDSAATSANFVDDILDEVCEAQGSYTLRQIASVALSILAGVTATNGAVLKTPNGVATRVTATIDANQQRTAMTLTP